MDRLPEELLADIVGRLPLRSLAVCRSVRNDWCATIDARRMLLAVAHLVPHRLRGIYLNFVSQDRPYFFSRGPENPVIDAALEFMWGLGPMNSGSILDHRNGLLLYKTWTKLYYVCNPATRRWIKLPTRPFSHWPGSKYLVFDPTVSLHYDVIFFPGPPLKYRATKQDLQRFFPKCPSLGADWKYRRVTNRGLGSMPWPPASYPVQVFSSRTGQWEEKHFVREDGQDDMTVTVSDVWSDPWGRTSNRQYHGVYWREKFYVHCLGGFIVRFSLQKEKYLVIKTPKFDNIISHPRLADSNERKKDIIPCVYIGKSQQGIYYTAIYQNQLRVWVLHEESNSRGVPEWELKHQANLKSSFSRHYARFHTKKKTNVSWILDRGDRYTKDRRNHEWDSDNDSGVDVGGEEDGEEGEEEVGSMTDYWDEFANGMSDILGFHPHKEIIFFGKRSDGFAYYLSSSKLQYWGSYHLTRCRYNQEELAYESFIYTPCMYDMLPLREEDDDNNGEDDNNNEEYDDDDYDDHGDYDDDDEKEEHDDDGDIDWM